MADGRTETETCHETGATRDFFNLVFASYEGCCFSRRTSPLSEFTKTAQANGLMGGVGSTSGRYGKATCAMLVATLLGNYYADNKTSVLFPGQEKWKDFVNDYCNE